MTDKKLDLSALSLPRKVMLGSALLLLVVSFLPWYSIDIGLVSVNENGWHQLGVLAWLFAVVIIAVEALVLFGALPLDEDRGALLSLGAAALTLLFGLIYVIQRLSDGYLGFGFFLGLVGLVALGAGTWLRFKESNAQETIRRMQGGTTGSA